MGCRVTVITSAGGGVGKTTVAMNAAIQLNNRKKRVLLLDLSLYGGIEVLVRKNNKTTGLGSLYSLFEQEKPLDINKAILSENETLGCDVLINTSALTMEKMNIDFMDQLFRNIHLAGYDEVVVDTSSELSERNSKVFLLADQIIYVITQDVSVCWRTVKHLEILEKLQIDRGKIKIIMNRYKKDIVFNVEEFEEEVNVKISGRIYDKKSDVINMHNSGKTILQSTLSRFSKKLVAVIDELWRVE